MSREAGLDHAPHSEKRLVTLPNLEQLSHQPEARDSYWGSFVELFRAREANGSYKHEERCIRAAHVLDQCIRHPGLIETDGMKELLMVAVQEPDTARVFCAMYESLSWRDSVVARRAYALASVILEQERQHERRRVVEHDTKAFRITSLPGVALPEALYQDPYVLGLAAKNPIKHEAQFDEIIWALPAGGPSERIVMKRVQDDKATKNLPSKEYELAMLERAYMLGLPGPRPLGMIEFGRQESTLRSAYILMTFEEGQSGVDLYQWMIGHGWSLAHVHNNIKIICAELGRLAHRFRTEMGVDKRFYVKDCLIRFDETGNILRILPHDLELAHPFNPHAPEKIDTFQDVVNRLSPDLKQAAMGAEAAWDRRWAA